MMKHSVFFKNRDNKWDNALPLGNGCFGTMLYFEDHTLYMPMNHYEVYYNIRKNVLPADILKAKNDPNALIANTKNSVNQYGTAHRIFQERADANQPKGEEPYQIYRSDSCNAMNPEPYEIGGFSGSYPMTGDLVFTFDEELEDADQELTLYVEDAAVELKLEKAAQKFNMHTITARKDCMINKIQQTEKLLQKVTISMAPYRDLDAPEVHFEPIDPKTFAYTVKRLFEGAEKPFVFSGILKLVGAEGHLETGDYTADVVIDKAEEEFYILTGIFTDWRYTDTICEGLEQMNAWSKDLPAIYAEHAEYWKRFFHRSVLTLPDPFLEHVYYVNQYALDCCSGKDGIMKHHACGLNGLWDIRHPNLWGSMWYWDVNIQASFAGVFSSNRLDLAKVFSDGLRQYMGVAEDYAKTIHDMPGYAIDYPYQSYYCVWPWCAQYLWFLYEYSLDTEYLRNDAYPLFLKLCEFTIALFKYNDEKGYYEVYPDISPEQGPFAHNTTITIASVKYMLQFTLKAAEILGDEHPILENCRELLSKLPPYSFSGESIWGIHLKDSPDAPDSMWIRHPSMLMPLFPIGEYDTDFTDEQTLQWLSNTVDFLEDNAEIGIFGGSWIAAAAARLGRGQTALRLIYERGIDHMLRSNGLTAEETERFMNYCLISRQPLYYPCMMEFTGEMLAAVNEMLIQSQNDLIRVFPAIPDGDKEWYRMTRKGYSLHEYMDRYAEYDAWKDVQFDTMLAKGAFEVSACLKERELVGILVKSQKGGTVRVTSPFLKAGTPVTCEGEPVAYTYDEKGIVSFATEEGRTYVIGQSFAAKTDGEYNRQVLMRENYMKRRIFIGEDSLTEYYKTLDSFIRDWYLGNMRLTNHTLYKFDFGNVRGKTYTQTISRPAHAAEEMVIRSMAFNQIGTENLPFTVKRGFGFSNCEGIAAGDSGIADCLRRDFIEGTEPTEFVIEVPRSQYEVMVIAGDENEDHVTILETENGFRTGGDVVKAGQYQCEIIPIMQKKDKPIRLRISTVPGKKWKLNCLILNVIKGY